MIIAEEIRSVLNKVSRENASDTPDYLLAEYLMRCLIAAEDLINSRDKWWKSDDLQKDRE